MLFFAWSLVLSAFNYARKQRIISILSKHFLSPLAFQKTIICIRHKQPGIKEVNSNYDNSFIKSNDTISSQTNISKKDDIILEDFKNLTPDNKILDENLVKSPQLDSKNLTDYSLDFSYKMIKKISNQSSLVEKAQSEQMLHKWDNDENVLYSKDNLEIITQTEPYKLYESEWDIIDKKRNNLIDILKDSISNPDPIVIFITHLQPVSYSNMELLKKVFGDVVDATIESRIKEKMENALPPLDLDSEIIYNLPPLLLDNFCKRIAIRKTDSNDIIFKCNLDTFYNIVYYWSESALYSAHDLSFVDSITCISPSYVEILSDIDANCPILLQPSLLARGSNLQSSLSSSLVSLNNSVSSLPLNNSDLPLLELLYILDQQNPTENYGKTSTLPSNLRRRRGKSECLSNKYSYCSDSSLYNNINTLNNYGNEKSTKEQNYLERINYNRTNNLNSQPISVISPYGSLRSLRESSNYNKKIASTYRPPLPSTSYNKDIKNKDEKTNFKIPHNLLWGHTSRFSGFNNNFYNFISNTPNFSNDQIRSLGYTSGSHYLEKNYIFSDSEAKKINQHCLDKKNSTNEKELVYRNSLICYPYKFRYRSFSESEDNYDNIKDNKNIINPLNEKLTMSLEDEKLIGHFSTKYPFCKSDLSDTIPSGKSLSIYTYQYFNKYKKNLIQIRNRKSRSCLPDDRQSYSINDIKENRDILIHDNNKIFKNYFKNMFAENHFNIIEKFNSNNTKQDNFNKMKFCSTISKTTQNISNESNTLPISKDLTKNKEECVERRRSLSPRFLSDNCSSIRDFITNQISSTTTKSNLRRYSYTPSKVSLDILTPPLSLKLGESSGFVKSVLRMDRSNNALCYPLVASNNFINGKPPKILIFTGKDYKLFFKVKETIGKLVTVDYYTIHQLPFDKLKTDLWMEPSTALLIICDTYSLDNECWAKLQIYFSNNGRVIFLCQNSILDNFKCTKKWSTKDSWIKKLFNGKKTSKGINKEFNNFLKKCHRHFKHNEDINEKFNAFDSSSGTNYSINFKKEKNAPLLLFLEGSGSNALALFSDASTEEIITSRFFDDVKDILKKTGIKMNNTNELSNDMKMLTIGNLLLKDDNDLQEFEELKFLEDYGNNPIITFYPYHYNFTKIRTTNRYFQSIQHVPKGIIIRDFDVDGYFKHLKTKTLGHKMIHIDTCESIIKISNSLTYSLPTYDGIVVIGNTQTYGKINGDNQWISPKGCALFSFDFNVPIDSRIGSKVTFLQHILGLSIIDSIKNLTQIPDFPIQVKWPNGIYYDKKVKIGYVRMKCSVYGNVYKCIISGGINIDNSKPTTCINDLLPNYKDPKLSVPIVIAEILNNFEKYSKNFERKGCEQFIGNYIKYWMHNNEDIYVDIEDLQLINVPCIVCGLDNDGFLIAKEKATKRIVKVYDTGKMYENLKGRTKGYEI
ncbi:Biotin--protein ligase [Strongyloides ratti]|uniref:Biotin--protein ligase n=1 Tax=Strongyloides ratti TaxID=34506 RepID=A0A090LSZ8_STRRB|nr:Biotin--protein ligase [Strongyloides ratti]CEF71337.1 Biotin--protein ligase [Strongyloides ratti]